MPDPLSAHGHRTARRGLRVFGATLAALGALLTAIGLAGFFSATTPGAGFPRLFWLATLGLPMLSVGLWMLIFGFLGTIARYQGREIGPAASRTSNEVAQRSGPGLREVFAALRQGHPGGGQTCRACDQPNDEDAAYCRACGVRLGSTCPGCGAPADPGARFCDRCGMEARNN